MADNMEGIKTGASPSEGYVVVSRPGTVFIEARIITQNDLDIVEVGSIGNFIIRTNRPRSMRPYKLDYPPQAMLALSNWE
jgi:hypothetical protein